ncbi:MAG: phage holin [Lachnospiraceae bacterium]|nr:phage holin [Lachnospiraceae bacterium]
MKKSIEKTTIIRTAVLVFALINQALTIGGRSPLPFLENDFEQGASMILTVSASLWAWWKNNSFTQAAIAADEQLKKPWK